MRFVEDQGFNKVSLLGTDNIVEENVHFLLCGGTRIARKTSFMLRIMQEYYNCGYKIISLTDVKDNMEVPHCIFAPFQDWQINQITNVQKEEIRTLPCEVLHPFTFSIPKKNIPEIKPFTISIKSLSESEIQFLSGMDDNFTIKLMNQTLNGLKSSEGFYDFVHNSNDAIIQKEKVMGNRRVAIPDPENFFLRVPSAGDRKSIREIGSMLKIFGNKYDKHTVIAEDNFHLNLDVLKMMNDQKMVSALSLRYINRREEKVRDFVVLWLLSQIEQNIGNAKYPILIIVDELKFLIPKNPIGYRKILSNKLRNFLSIIAGMGVGCSTIFNAQSYFSIDDQVIECFTAIMWGKQAGVKEIDKICKALGLSSSDKENINMIQPGQWVLKGSEENLPMNALLPCFTLPNPRISSYDELFKENYPDRMRNYSELLDRMKQKIDGERKMAEDRSKKTYEDESKNIERMQRFKEKKNESELEEVKKEKQELKTEVFASDYKRIIALIESGDNSDRAIAREVEVTHPVVGNVRRIYALLKQGKSVDEVGIELDMKKTQTIQIISEIVKEKKEIKN